jgi:hypothetical protein
MVFVGNQTFTAVSRLKTTLLIVSLFALSFLREYIFEGINDRLYRLQSSQSDYPFSTGLEILAPLSYYPLYYLKFVLILLFTLIFAWLTLWTIEAWFKQKKYIKPVLWLFGGVFSLSALLFVFGLAIGYGHEAYAVARHLIELIQSPLAAFMLIVSLRWEAAKQR